MPRVFVDLDVWWFASWVLVIKIFKLVSLSGLALLATTEAPCHSYHHTLAHSVGCPFPGCSVVGLILSLAMDTGQCRFYKTQT
jgi:hypothetical protein